MRPTTSEVDLRIMQERIAEKNKRDGSQYKISGAPVMTTTTPPKKNKYGNKIIHADGKKFDSKKEYGRYLELVHMESISKIKHFDCQVKFPILINESVVCSYIADFVITNHDGTMRVEDVKSSFTRTNPVYRIKCKLMKAVLKIDIVEI